MLYLNLIRLSLTIQKYSHGHDLSPFRIIGMFVNLPTNSFYGSLQSPVHLVEVVEEKQDVFVVVFWRGALQL